MGLTATSTLPPASDRDAAAALLSARAVRDRAHEMLGLAENDLLPEYRIDAGQIEPCADYVAGVIRQRYPDLGVPFHARWRHFVFAGRDLWAEMEQRHGFADGAARARARFDLAITSVLLDAGAGPDWRYRDAATGIVSGRSEGLALASLRMFEAGMFSRDPADPLRADADKLASLDLETLLAGFQVGPDNPLTGAEGRLSLLNALGRVAKADPEGFARVDGPRPGGLFDALTVRASDAQGVRGAHILGLLLEKLGGIWPGRHQIGGVSLGDCWRHPAMRRDDATNGFVPFHKLSQWMSYSLAEPLEQAGFSVTDIDGLTGLAEYRNGGLFLDVGVIVPRDVALLERAHQVGDPAVVAWRALTVALLDRLAGPVRDRLGVSAEAFPLARMLEGGTWAAGRAIAAEKRTGGGPPLAIVADGTVF